MDSLEDETTYQYFTIRNDESNVIDIQDMWNLPSVPDETDSEKIFYLTFDDGNTEGDTNGEDETLSKVDELSETVSFNATDVKLITLEDGRMFMTTEQDLAALQSTSAVIKENKLEDDCSNVENDEHTFPEPSPSSADEEEDQLDDSNYRLVQLADGTQAVVKLVKIENNNKKAKKFKCKFAGCEKVYVTSYHLTVHMRSHTDCKPYKCTIDGCEKCFSTNYSLKAHIRTHTGEKPYACSVCSKQFKTSGDLQKHIRIHTGEKPFMCPIVGCGKSFTTSNIRKVHVRSHTGERPYSCNHPNCGKAFTSSTNYKNHLRIHSGERPYLCPVEGCGKRFTEYSSLYKHNAVHQPVRPHVCVFCGQRFKQESRLTFHKRLMHNVVVTKDGTEIIVKIE